LLAVCFVAPSGLAITTIAQYRFDCKQNIFPLDFSRHGVFHVGDVYADKTAASKKCADLCGSHDWCGAFIVWEEGDGKCHLVPDVQVDDTEIYHGHGEYCGQNGTLWFFLTTFPRRLLQGSVPSTASRRS